MADELPQDIETEKKACPKCGILMEAWEYPDGHTHTGS